MLGRKWICGKCLHLGKAAYRKRGSARLEVSGWLLFPLGVPYTLWRMFSQIPLCASCGNDVLIAPNSAVGLRLIDKMERQRFGEPATEEKIQF